MLLPVDPRPACSFLSPCLFFSTPPMAVSSASTGPTNIVMTRGTPCGCGALDATPFSE